MRAMYAAVRAVMAIYQIYSFKAVIVICLFVTIFIFHLYICKYVTMCFLCLVMEQAVPALTTSNSDRCSPSPELL
jgi:hypothetical protein